jgi:ribosomal protein L36
MTKSINCYNRVIRRVGIEEVLLHQQPQREKPYDLQDLVLELLTLLEVSNVICKDNLSFKARQYIGMPESASNTFGTALGHPEFNGIGGDLV